MWQRVRATPASVAAQVATRIAFLIAGLGTAAWAPLVPYAKQRLSIDEGALGLLLLCGGAGSLTAMPLAGTMTTRLGCRRVIGTTTLCICASLIGLAAASSPILLALALFFFGAGVGGIDVAMNIQAVIVEEDSGRPLMSGFHGLFSAGGIAGASGASLLLWTGASTQCTSICIGLVIVVLLLICWRHLLSCKSVDESPTFVFPRGAVLLVGILCFISFLTEGAMLDWSAVFLTTVRSVDPIHSGLGYTIFAVAMTAGRLSGDRIVQVVGKQKLLLFGGVCAASGLVLVVLAPWPTATCVGFGIVGLGASNIVPVLYSTLEHQRVMPANLAVAGVTTIGYFGILAGPAMIGLMAHAAGLPAAFLVIAAMLVFLAASSQLATR
jgi:predicted MFS family arabinose efflux permease